MKNNGEVERSETIQNFLHDDFLNTLCVSNWFNTTAWHVCLIFTAQRRIISEDRVLRTLLEDNTMNVNDHAAHRILRCQKLSKYNTDCKIIWRSYAPLNKGAVKIFSHETLLEIRKCHVWPPKISYAKVQKIVPTYDTIISMRLIFINTLLCRHSINLDTSMLSENYLK